MYNSFREGEAKFAMDEFVDASKSMDSAVNDFETAADNACGSIDDLENERDELVIERDELQEKLDKAEDEIEAREHNATAKQCIEALEAMLKASEAMTTFATINLTRLRKAYGLEESSPDSSTGADSNGDREVSFDEDGKPIAPPGLPS